MIVGRCRQRPYFVEYTRSHPNSEVKRRKARSVLGWGTAREDLRVLPAFWCCIACRKCVERRRVKSRLTPTHDSNTRTSKTQNRTLSLYLSPPPTHAHTYRPTRPHRHTNTRLPQTERQISTRAHSVTDHFGIHCSRLAPRGLDAETCHSQMGHV